MATFPKSERIQSKLVLEKAYKEGAQIKIYPFVLKYVKCDLDDGAKLQIVISIPKRLIKQAVNRNRIRRQIKEIYRLNKDNLLSHFENEEKGLALFLIYTGKENQDYKQLESKLKLVLTELQTKL